MIRFLSLATLLTVPALAQTNIAPAGVASESSIYSGSHAARGNDGIRDGDWYASSVFHTGSEMNSWWQVDFSGQLYEMFEIRIFPRTDCCTVRNSNFRLSVFQGTTEVWGENYYAGSGEVPAAGELVPLPAGTFGDRVRIQLNGLNNEGNGWLHMAEVEIDGTQLGTGFCGPAQLNSSGQAAEIIAVGSGQAGGAPFGLVASGLPEGEFGYFLASRNTGSLQPPASNGILCLSGNIGRFVADIRNSGPGGDSIGITVDTTAVPVNPTAPVLQGETWYFQAWFRDGASSNFSDAVCVSF